MLEQMQQNITENYQVFLQRSAVMLGYETQDD